VLRFGIPFAEIRVVSLAALELEVRDASTEVMDNLDYEGDDGEA
jgi:hypothetical protein